MLIVTFRSFVTAGLPLVTALIGVALSMLLIFVATAFAPVSSTTPLLALMLGLAVGIDYALFIIARQQDQVRAGADPEESAARATGTAGSAVLFAGMTVLIALIGLSFANIPFLTDDGDRGSRRGRDRGPGRRDPDPGLPRIRQGSRRGLAAAPQGGEGARRHGDPARQTAGSRS